MDRGSSHRDRRSRSRSADRSRRDDSHRDSHRDAREHRRSRSRSPQRHRDERRRSRTRSRSRERPTRDRDRDRDRERERERDRHRESSNRDRDRRDDRGSSEADKGSSATLAPAASVFSSMRQSSQPVAATNVSSNAAAPATNHESSLTQLTGLAKAKAQAAEEDAMLSKPVFLTKQQREQLALQRMAEARAATVARTDAERSTRLDSIAHSATSTNNSNQRSDHARPSAAAIAEERAREKELDLIKQSYLGGPKVNKKQGGTLVSKSKVVFDWANDEDTSVDANPLYQKRADIALGFGRAFLGGIDIREQRKSAKFYDDLAERRVRSGDAVAPLPVINEDKARAREELQRVKDAERAKATRHWSEKALDEMTERDWRIFREDFNITTRGGKLPNPLRNWEEADLPYEIMDALRRAGYKEPSAIQRQAIPIGLQNRDLMGIAETGSGKTCAFLVPMLVYILNQPKMTAESALDGPYAIILAPTRELAQQIDEECQKFAQYTKIRAHSIVGGMSIQEQSMMLRAGLEVLVATPGRVVDCLESRYLVLNQCNYVVLDEADRMLEMGFEKELNAILDAMPSSNMRPIEEEFREDKSRTYRQTIMFSATMPLKVEQLARNYLRNPAYIAIGDRHMKAVDRITQTVEFCKEHEKFNRLLSILEHEEPPIIIFCNGKNACDSLSRRVNEQGYRSTVMHGDKSQDQRMKALGGFKGGQGADEREFDILIATDVAGRGIDVKGVTHVINYEMSKSIEAYAHRIGRTGRAGMDGRATSFLTPSDTDVLFDLKEFLTTNKQVVPAELARHEAAQVKPGTVSQSKPKSIVYASK